MDAIVKYFTIKNLKQNYMGGLDTIRKSDLKKKWKQKRTLRKEEAFNANKAYRLNLSLS